MWYSCSVATIVPTYNEGRQISKVIEGMPSYVDHIVIIDDASTDDTSSIVQRYRIQNSRLILLTHPVNQGVGGAIATGYQWARDNQIDIAVVMAGDAQMDPEELPQLLTPISQNAADYTKGNRLLSGTAFRIIPKTRYFGNAILSFLTKIASGYWHVADSQSGYTAINKQALHTLDWPKMYKRYGQPNDLLVMLNVFNFRVKDIPIEPRYHVGEQSKLKIYRVMFPISWLLIRRFFWRIKEKYIIRDFHPLVFFYLLGFISIVLCSLFLGRLVYLYCSRGHVPELSFLSFWFSLTLGLQLLFFAMWCDMESNKHLK